MRCIAAAWVGIVSVASALIAARAFSGTQHDQARMVRLDRRIALPQTRPAPSRALRIAIGETPARVG